MTFTAIRRHSVGCVQVPIQKRRIKWLACKMLSAAGVLETDEPQRASVSTRLPLPSSDFALLTAFV
jgi:hypothetical protein